MFRQIDVIKRLIDVIVSCLALVYYVISGLRGTVSGGDAVVDVHRYVSGGSGVVGRRSRYGRRRAPVETL